MCRLRLDQRIHKPRTRGDSPGPSRVGTAGRARTPNARRLQNAPTASSINSPSASQQVSSQTVEAVLPPREPSLPKVEKVASRPGSPGSPLSSKPRPMLPALMMSDPPAAPAGRCWIALIGTVRYCWWLMFMGTAWWLGGFKHQLFPIPPGMITPRPQASCKRVLTLHR